MKALIARLIASALVGVGVFLVSNGIMDQSAADALIAAFAVGGAQAGYALLHKGLRKVGLDDVVPPTEPTG